MPLTIVLDDIVNIRADVLVNPTHSEAYVGKGVDYALYQSGGIALFEARKKLGLIEPGTVKHTEAFSLQAKYVFHTVGPIWEDGLHNEFAILTACYERALELAISLQVQSIAFPLIASGAFGFPKEKALEIARTTIESFLHQNELDVFLVIFDKESYQLSRARFQGVQTYLDRIMHHLPKRRSDVSVEVSKCDNFEATILSRVVTVESVKSVRKLNAPLFHEQSQPFSVLLNDWIERSGMTSVEVYKRANISRKTFSKIMSNIHYQPSKPTAVAFAIALRLNLKQTQELLDSAGYSLSNAIKFDVIIKYHILQKKYNVLEINEVLFEHDQVLMGCL